MAGEGIHIKTSTFSQNLFTKESSNLVFSLKSSVLNMFHTLQKIQKKNIPKIILFWGGIDSSVIV